MFWLIGAGFLHSSVFHTRAGQAAMSIAIASMAPWIPAAIIGAFFWQDLDQLYLQILQVSTGLTTLFALWVVLDPPDDIRTSPRIERTTSILGGLIASILFVGFLGASFYVSLQVAGPRGVVAGTDSSTLDVFLEADAVGPSARLGVDKVKEAVKCPSASSVGPYGEYCDAWDLRFVDGAVRQMFDSMLLKSRPLLLVMLAVNFLAAVVLLLYPPSARPAVPGGQVAGGVGGTRLEGGALGPSVGNVFHFALTWLIYFIPLSLVTQVWAGSSASEGAGGGLEELLHWVALFGVLSVVSLLVANVIDIAKGGCGKLFNSHSRERAIEGFGIAAVLSFVWFVSHAPPKPGWWFGGPLGAMLGLIVGLYEVHVKRAVRR